MKKILDKVKLGYLFAFILGGIIIGSVGVYASNIELNPKSWTV